MQFSASMGFRPLVIFGALGLALLGCSQGCPGPALNPQVAAIRSQGPAGQGPQAFLILPNPIDATQSNDPMSAMSSTQLIQSGAVLNLIDLLDPTHLQNAFLHVRISSISDPLSSLATPNSKGAYAFQPTDVHYSETMAYRSVTAAQSYVEALGFTVNQTRPLYVMVRAGCGSGSGSTSSTSTSSCSSDVNAFFDNAYLDPSSPRTIQVYGSGPYAPGMDQDIYWHEFGHMVNESVSGERGIDYAGDSGAVYTEGAALHECLADYLSESLSNKAYIGRWIARDLGGYAPGAPLRSAEDPVAGQKENFSSVAVADGTGAQPDRYGVGEWCTRVMWEIRQGFVNEDPQQGAGKSDRLVYTAVSQLARDTSISQFQKALLSADQGIHCGGHAGTINAAFQSRGFQPPAQMDKPLGFSATPAYYVMDSSGNYQSSGAVAGADIVFNFQIQNSSSVAARNVRVRLEPMDNRLHALTYEQGYGDLAPNQTLIVGGSNGLTLDFSLAGQIDQNSAVGQKISYQLRVLSENGQDVVFPGVIQL